MIIEGAEALREWLASEMAPICDADPGALAKYVMALLKKEKNEQDLRDFCIEQLDVFLQKETRSFVEKLFNIIKEKAYLNPRDNHASNSKTDSQLPTSKSLESAGAGRASEPENNAIPSDEQRSRGGDNRRRKSPLVREERRPVAAGAAERYRRSRSRSPRRRPVVVSRVSRPPERYSARPKRSRSRSPHEVRHERKEKEKKEEPPVEKKKKRCRDYDEKGYCMRGDLCPYDHGPDPVVVDDSALEKMVNIGGTKGGPLPNFSVPPPGYTPVNPPPPGVDNVYMANTVAPIVEGYNPEAPALSGDGGGAGMRVAPDFSVPPPPLPTAIPRAPWTPSTYLVPQSGTMPMGAMGVAGRGGLAGRLGPPRFPVNPSCKTLQVRKVPPHLNSIAKLNEHFGQFGQITNIQVRYGGDPEGALITYSSRHEAISAYKSTAPILNNRFIKVFWHGGENLAGIKERLGGTTDDAQDPNQPRPGGAVVFHQGSGNLTKTVPNEAPGANGAAKSTFPVGRPTKRANPASQGLHDNDSYVQVRKKRKLDKERRMRMLELQKRKAELYAKQTVEQKTVLGQLEKCGDPKMRKHLYKLFQALDNSVKKLKSEMEEMTKTLATMEKVDETRVEMPAKSKEQLERETLDVELELMNASIGPPTADLQRRLADLKRQLLAAPTAGGQAMTSTPMQMESRSRATAPDAASSIDKRNRHVQVRGFAKSDEQMLVAHMQRFGPIEDVDVDEDRQGGPRALFTYKRRKDAEQAMDLASDFADGVSLELQWARGSRRESQSDVIPDEERPANEQMTPAALLASIGTIESDDEENENAVGMNKS